MEKAIEEESWNKKKIFIAFIALTLFVGGIYFFKDFILNKSKALFFKSPSIDITKDVKGTNAVENASSIYPTSAPQTLSGVQQVVQQKLETIKQEITTLNVQDIASSTPQLQKIINDLQSLQQYPRNELKDVCQRLCGGL